MFKSRKHFSIISVLMIVILILNTSIYITSASTINLDDFLREIGVPESVILELPYEKKQLIYNTMDSSNAEFAGYEKEEFILNDNGSLNNPDVSLCGGLIPSSDLTLSVIGFNETARRSDGTYYIRYNVYPSFVWHTPVVLSNDSFGMSMYSGWEAVPGERNLQLYANTAEGDQTLTIGLNPAQSHQSGYVYKVPSTYCQVWGYYSGHAYYYLDKTSTTASPRISLHYVHDNSPSVLFSYSLNILSFGSITVSGNTNYIYEMSDNFEVPGLVS